MKSILTSKLHQKTIEVFHEKPSKRSDFHTFKLFAAGKQKVIRRRLPSKENYICPQTIAKDMLLEYEVEHNLKHLGKP